MQTYLRLLETLLNAGEQRSDRTGTGTLSVFGYSMEFDLEAGFPLLTTKKLHVPSIIYELLWFLRGDTNTAYLTSKGVKIWDEWADMHGNLGRIYGAQWRDWKTPEGDSVDQISQLIECLRCDPYSRRHIVSAWNPGELKVMNLPPCHILIQFYVDNNRGLHCQLYQRSADVFLGVPFNIASYALLTSMVAQVTGLQARRFIWVGGDVHLYLNHVRQATEQLQRTPKALPTLELTRHESIFDYDYDSIRIVHYEADPNIQAGISV